MNHPFQKPYPNRLRRYRKKAGFTQKELAKLIGHRTAAHISRYEHGAKLPSLITALKICSALDTIVDVAFDELVAPVREEVRQRQEKSGLWGNPS